MEFDKKKVNNDLRRSKKTFNIVIRTLVTSLMKLFSGDSTLMFFNDEIARIQQNPKEDHVAAVKFFKTANLQTNIVVDGSKAFVGDLILSHDERLFQKDAGISIPALDALGISDKWPLMKQPDRENVWKILERLIYLATQVVVGTKISDGALNDIMKSTDFSQISTILAKNTSE